MNFNDLIFKNILNSFLKEVSIKKTYVKTLKANLKAILKFKRIKFKRSNNFKEINFKLLKPNFKPLKKALLTKYTIKKNFNKSENKYTLKNVKRSRLQFINHYPPVTYIIDITQTSSNQYLNILTSAGKLKLSVSTGNLLDFSLIKRKSINYYMLKAALKVITKQKYLRKNSLAVHVKNSNFINKLTLGLTKKRLKLAVVSRFSKRPFNGCRKKKLRSL